MSEQEAVEQVEATTETESAPVEQNTDTTTEEVTPESADTIVEPEVNNQGVPYDRFSEVNSKAKRLQAENDQLRRDMAETQEPIQDLDPDAAKAVRKEIQAEANEREYNKFRTKNGIELNKDPLLEAAYNVEINREVQTQNDAGTRNYIDREEMLERARTTLSERIGTAKVEAKKEGVTQGQDIARTKQQLGAVGETGKQAKVDPEDLSAADYAKAMGIPSSNY